MKRLRILSLLLVAISIFVSCSGIPPEPEVEICNINLKFKSLSDVDSDVRAIDWDSTYVSCISDINPTDPSKKRKVSLSEYLQEKNNLDSKVNGHVTLSLEDYLGKISWGDKIRDWGKKHCK